MLWQPIRPFEFTSPVVDVIKYRLLAIKPLSTLIFANPYLRSKLTTRQVNERILEIPFVLLKIKNYKLKILDVGSNESSVSLMLASIGHKVTSLDLRKLPFIHSNIENIKADITKWERKGFYDTVICLSTLEHIGLDVYGGTQMINGDQLAINNIFSSLKTGGKLLLTVPASYKYFVTPSWRSYDKSKINNLLKRFKRVKYKFGIRDERQCWHLVDEISQRHLFDSHMPSAVALIEATK